VQTTTWNTIRRSGSSTALLGQGWNISSNDEYRVTVLSSEYRTPTGQRRFRHIIETVDSYRRTSGEAFSPLPPIRQSELG